MKTLVLTIVLSACSLITWAQHPSVNFNYELTNFDGGQPLLAETYFIVNGSINDQVSMVEIMIFDKNGKESRNPLFRNIWKRESNDGRPSFQLPVNYKLRGASEYDFKLTYYRPATAEELGNVREELFHSLDAYLDQNLILNKKQINLLKNGKSIAADMNRIVADGLIYYKSPLDMKFPGFSNIVADQIDHIRKNKYDHIMGEQTTQSQKAQSADKLIKDLKIRIHSEVAHIFNAGLSVIGDSKYVDNYTVEETKTVLNLHAGFGGASLDKDFKDKNFGSATMVGLTLPLGRSAFRGKFWSNTALMTGIYLKDFDSGEDGVKVSGPIVEKPIYVGLGYRLFRFVRLSAGVTVLENKGTTLNDGINTDVYIRPFVGLTGDIKLWADFGSK